MSLLVGLFVRSRPEWIGERQELDLGSGAERQNGIEVRLWPEGADARDQEDTTECEGIPWDLVVLNTDGEITPGNMQRIKGTMELATATIHQVQAAGEDEEHAVMAQAMFCQTFEQRADFSCTLRGRLVSADFSNPIHIGLTLATPYGLVTADVSGHNSSLPVPTYESLGFTTDCIVTIAAFPHLSIEY